MLNQIKQFYRTLVVSIKDFLECGNLDEATAITLPAVGWHAVYKIDDEMQYFPLVAWNVVYKDDEPTEAVGLVFVGNQPPFVEYADESPQFVGYQLNGNWATFPQVQGVTL